MKLVLEEKLSLIIYNIFPLERLKEAEEYLSERNQLERLF
jgi:hypothetical protein